MRAPLVIDRSLARDLEAWKPAITAYSERHYGEATWRLEPSCIVLHYTAFEGFPWNLVETTSHVGEPPGLASHYVVDRASVWELLPPNVRSRAAYGINHRAINIEMVAPDAVRLSERQDTLGTSASLCLELMARFDITLERIYSHQQVATMDRSLVPEVLDLVRPTPYDKIDPGAQNMAAIKALIRSSG